jgi:hypothetical protein
VQQTRPDRDDLVRINDKNVKKKSKKNFQKNDDSDTFGSPYDYGSVMHYSATQGGDGTAITLEALKETNGIMGQRNGPSDLDIIKLHLLYQCISGPRNFDAYRANLCTSDCKCWAGATGCNGSNEACQGSLVCSNNKCVEGNGSTGGGTTAGCTDFQGWRDLSCNDCGDYQNNATWCGKYGDSYAGSYMKNAKEACCTCGGGSLAGPTFFTSINFFAGKCLDLYRSDTTNGNFIILSECNGSAAQKWWLDSNGYIRSAVNTNKCSK